MPCAMTAAQLICNSVLSSTSLDAQGGQDVCSWLTTPLPSDLSGHSPLFQLLQIFLLRAVMIPLGKVAGKLLGPIRTEFKGYLAARSQSIASSHQNDNLPGHGLLEVLPRDDGLCPQRGLPVLPWVTGRQGGRAR